jgi:hypothetical protein
MPDDPPRPEEICPTCKTELRSDFNRTAREQLSASGVFCEECIMKHCDTAANRQAFLVESGLYNAFLLWANGKYWPLKLDPESAHYDEFTHKDAMYNFMDGIHDYDYFVWLMQAN